MYVSFKFTRLSAVLRLCNLKVENGWSNKSFTALFKLVKNMLPEDNELLNHMYKAKKIMHSMSMDYDKMHAYPNDCILYQKKYEYLENFLVCGRSLHKTNDKSLSKLL